MLFAQLRRSQNTNSDLCTVYGLLVWLTEHSIFLSVLRERMRAVVIDAASHYIAPPSLPCATVVELKDACVGNTASEDYSALQFKRTIIQRLLQQSATKTDFIDRLLEQEPSAASEIPPTTTKTATNKWTVPQTPCTAQPTSTRMPFGAKVENGLIKEDFFVDRGAKASDAMHSLSGCFASRMSFGGSQAAWDHNAYAVQHGFSR